MVINGVIEIVEIVIIFAYGVIEDLELVNAIFLKKVIYIAILLTELQVALVIDQDDSDYELILNSIHLF